jgi:hypothetical protein
MEITRGLIVAVVLAILSVPVSVGSSLADPPPGDTCASPIPIQFGVDQGYTGDLGPYANDYDAGLPGPSCTGAATPGKDAVFAVEVGCGEYLTVHMNPVGFDGALYVVTDCADIAGSCVSGSDEAGVGVGENVYVQGFIPRTYYVVADAHNADAGAVFDLSFGFGSWDIPPGACCFPDGHCEIIHIDFCAEAGGITLGPCQLCEPNPCSPVPALERSWGAVKAQYR